MFKSCPLHRARSYHNETFYTDASTFFLSSFLCPRLLYFKTARQLSSATMPAIRQALPDTTSHSSLFSW